MNMVRRMSPRTQEALKNPRFLVQLLIVPPALAALGISLTSAVLEATRANCDVGRTDLLPATRIFVLGVAALIAGRAFSLVETMGTATESTARGAAFFAAWCLIFLASAGVWFFEAMGTTHVAVDASGAIRYQPITYYVRCAAYQDIANSGFGFWTSAVVAALSFLIGDWLWSWRIKMKRAKKSGDD
jgi:hypothetical protein